MLAYSLAPFVSKCNISANSVTMSRLFFIIFYAFATVSYSSSIAIVAFSLFSLWLFSFLDALDGEVAKISRTSMLGRWLDPQIDRIGTALIFLVNSYLLLQTDYPLRALLPFLVYILIDLNNGIIRDVNYKPKFSVLNQPFTASKTLKVSYNPKSNSNKSLISLFALNTHLHVHNICLLLIITSIFKSPLAFILLCFVRAGISLFYTGFNMYNRIITFDKNSL